MSSDNELLGKIWFDIVILVIKNIDIRYLCLYKQMNE